MIDAAFVAFGEDAMWTGIEAPVRIRFGTSDEEGKFSESGFISRGDRMRVRQSEVPAPNEGDIVSVATGLNAGTYRLVGEPILGSKRVWDCDVTVVR
ncbi:head-tail joining protein [Sphingomonas sp. PAMC 26605]|uniref:head-tail joining protein n=1 Tax=Sphingomonas sp. PAMC 26605 TaxID=1112214 RepID=UPI0012F489D6|nr:hypothetical protein [Sphingomonas sp. PAMC 26605]